jgi:hydrogenase expression/formation protein HypD
VKYLDEFRDPELARRLFDEIDAAATRPWAIMEVCGGQTHSIIRNGIDQLLPDTIELIHGPGCPVCVTPLEMIDRALAIAPAPDVIFCSFGDMLRVPGSRRRPVPVKARGGDVRVVYSPLDAVNLAAEHPDREVVFFAIGFETTAPANAMAVHQARAARAHQLLDARQPRARAAGDRGADELADDLPGARLPRGRPRVLGDGHPQYEPLVERFDVPIVVTGFEPLDVLDGIRRCVCSSSRDAARSRTPTPVRCAPRATWPRRRCSPRCSRSATGSGAASA